MIDLLDALAFAFLHTPVEVFDAAGNAACQCHAEASIGFCRHRGCRKGQGCNGHSGHRQSQALSQNGQVSSLERHALTFVICFANDRTAVRPRLDQSQRNVIAHLIRAGRMTFEG